MSCPFKGLAPFEPDDAELFFGRERLVDELLARLDGSTLLFLTGPSGSGKSSLLQAGLVSALEGRKVVIRPGLHPAAELAGAVEGDLPAALDRLQSGERLVIAVDQLEEAFAAAVSKDERDALLAALVEAAWDPERRALILLAMRGDFVDRLASYPELADLVAANQMLVGPMSASELRRAIEGPAERVGLVVEAPLVDALVHDVVGEPGGLPLLSAALVDLWRERSDSALTLEGYERSGGVRGAVARHAEAALHSLGEDEQPVARRIVLQLVAGGDGEPLTRRRASREELAVEDHDVQRVVAALVERRFLVADADSVELVHDALLQQWPRLTEWLDQEGDRRRLHRHLAQTAAAWIAADRDRSDLYRGARLAAAVEWANAQASQPTLSPLESEFLRESQSAVASETEKQRRMSRRRRSMLTLALVLLVVAAAAGAIALVENANAQQRAAAADAQHLGSQALVEPSLDTALLLAREGVNLDNSPATRSNLLNVLLRLPDAIGVASSPGERILDEALSPSGDLLAYRTDNGTLAFLNAHTLRRVGPSWTDPWKTQYAFMGGIPAYYPNHALAFSPDGHTLAMGSSTGDNADLFLLDTRTHRKLFSTSSPWAATADVFFSPDGRTLVTGEIVNGRSIPQPAEVIVNHSPRNLKERAESAPIPAARLIGFVDHGRELLVTTGNTSSVLLNAHTLHRVGHLQLGGAAAVSTSGELAAFGHANGSVILYDLQTGKRWTLQGHASEAIASLAFNHSGTTIASTAADGSVAAWDLATNSLLESFAGHTGAAEGPLFSPDGSTLYAGGQDGNLIAWDVNGLRRLGRPFRYSPTPRPGEGSQKPGLNISMPPIAVSPDGRLFATSPASGQVTLWRTRDEAVVGQLSAPTGHTYTLAFSHHGHLLAAAGTGTKIAIWNLAKPKVPRLLPTAGQTPYGLAFSPNDHLLATAGGNDTLRIYHLRTGRYTDAVYGGGSLQSVDFSSDGRFVAAAGIDGQILVLNLKTDNVRAINHDGLLIYTLAFAPHGDTIAAGDLSGDVDFWNADTGRQLAQQIANPGGPVVSLSYDPSGTRLMTVGSDGSIRLWAIPTDEPIGTLLPGAGSGGSATFFHNGKEIAAVFQSGTGVLWNVDPTRWSAQACKLAGRNLTRLEWRDSLPNRPYRKVCP